MEKSYNGKEVLVVGFGLSGQAAARFLLDRGAIVTACDRKPKQAEISVLSDSEISNIEKYSLIVLSPGIPLTHPIILAALEKNIEVIGEIELAARHLKNPFIGITGTNGKTTVSLLVGHILNHAKLGAKVVGNIGIPLTSIEGGWKGSLVCELSSYQIETLQSKVIDAGVILNITPDHLDRYLNMQNYAAAKIKMQKGMKEPRNLVVGQNVYKEYKALFNDFAPKTFGFTQDCDLYCDKNAFIVKENIEMLLPDKYRGRCCHDVENIMAAFALCRSFGVSSAVFLEGLSSFEKPSHRIEFVRAFCGVRFYDDSKGTNLDAVNRAVESLEGKVILIAGGVSKGVSFLPWHSTLSKKVTHIFAIGEAKHQIKQEMASHFQIELCETLESAVKKAFAIAQEGENVLLSPGCASFDMFKDYADRGDQFKKIVGELT